MILRPMLGAAVQLHEIRFPVIASPKLDGVRALGVGNEVRSRTLKMIPNLALQSDLSGCFEAWDGELIVGDPTAADVYQKTVSQVMTRDAPSTGITWFIFDHYLEPDKPYLDRYSRLPNFAPGMSIQRHVSRAIWTLDELLEYEDEVLQLGYEGLILRKPNGKYKMGRSTVKEGLLLKLKRFVDDEAPVIDFEELMHNANQPTKDERGYTKRSTHLIGQVPAGTLGALVVSWRGNLLRLGTGFTADQRRTIWENRSLYVGKLAKFKYLPAGMKDLPRHPVWLGWRHQDDS